MLLEHLEVHGNPACALGMQRLTQGNWPWLNCLTVTSTMLSPAVLVLLNAYAMPRWPTEEDKHSVIIPRHLADDDPGQALLWPSLLMIICVKGHGLWEHCVCTDT